MQKKLFVYKDPNGQYRPEYIIKNIDDDFSGLEYGDVVAKEYQIWEYPSGKIYDVVSDRILSGAKYEDYYGSPDENIWLPKLKYKKTDKNLVVDEYNRLLEYMQMPRPTLSQKLKEFFRINKTKD